MRIYNDIKLDFQDVLFKPMRSTLKSRSEVDLTRTFKFNRSGQEWRGVPILSANMDTVSTFEMADVLRKEGMLTVLHKFYTFQDWKDYILSHSPDEYESIANYVIPSIGISNKDLMQYEEIKSFFPLLKFLVVDVANGYSESFSNFIKMIRATYPQVIIITGNVATAEMTEQLILSGADIVKVGIGSGALCTTRLKAAVGIPQFSAVVDCANAAHGLDGHIISDGGIIHPGDISKAFGAGADFVMVGSMFAGYEQSGGDEISKWEQDGFKWENGSVVPNFVERHYKVAYGMSSTKANEKYMGGLKTYRTAEGREVLIPFRGDINTVVQDIKGSIASTMTYIGAKRLKDIPKCATFVRVNNTHNKLLVSREV